ncbi:MAG TPA: Asp23/Gls24 family envelope stress response protein [Eubacteriales bacterium]|nr:Asp23/Gls24 family envelope stress response protein [Clostridia bacterium]HRV72583.1 Asp23/Gls24 family envelope stress response protein [Eubacteriales bacterium]
MEDNKMTVENAVGGKIVFADDVVATIASLATEDVEGVAGLSGTAIEGLSEKLGKKSYTKGIKVEVGEQECAVDLTLIVKYGFRIQEVCKNVQDAVKSSIETMTGLKAVEVNIYVQSVTFPTEKVKEPAPKAPEPAPRVK